MWVEADQPADTFWQQTQRSFSNAIAGAARRRTTDAWRAANLFGAATAGKLPQLDTLLPSETAEPEPADWREHDAKLLHFFFKLKASNIPVEIERLH